nr:hypothetical protein [Thiobacillaceae bacterium]
MIVALRLLRVVLLAGLLCAAALVRADARVQVAADGAMIRVHAEIDTRVDRDLAWRVLTDYNRWSE